MENQMIELLNIDCMEYMKSVPDKFFDLAIVDPPYGVRGKWKTGGVSKHTRFDNNRRMGEWDKSPNKEYFDLLFSKSNKQIIWGANHYPEFLHFSRCWIVWDKLTGGNDYADCELAFTNFDMPVKKFTKFWLGAHATNGTDRIHPTEKPIQLYKWLLHNYAKPGDKIFDSHGGSMSIAIAAHQMGFDLVLTEIDKDYYDAGVKRFREQTMQGDLFKNLNK